MMPVRSGKYISKRTGKEVKYWDVDIVFHKPGTKRQTDRKCRHRKRIIGVSRRFAEQYEREMLKAILDGTFYETDRVEVPILKKFAPEFLESYVKVHNKPSEQSNKEMHLRVHLLPIFGCMRLDEIGPLEIDRYKARKLKEGLKSKTVNLHLSTLRRALVLAHEWQFIDTVPLFKRLKEIKPTYDFLKFDELERVIAAADPEWRAMIVIAAKTGMRLGELLALAWDDVDLVRGIITVRRNLVRGRLGTPKSGKNRMIDLSDNALSTLKQHRHLKGEIVFCTENGDFLTKEITKRPLWRACKRAGIRRIGWHALRHTFASHLAMRGAPAKAIQELLGHSSIEMTNRYMHLSPDSRREAVQLLDKNSGDRVNDVSTDEVKNVNQS